MGSFCQTTKLTLNVPLLMQNVLGLVGTHLLRVRVPASAMNFFVLSKIGIGSKLSRCKRNIDFSSELYCVLLRRRFEKALPFVPARYIRSFDILSEVNCVLIRRRKLLCYIENIVLLLNCFFFRTGSDNF